MPPGVPQRTGPDVVVRSSPEPDTTPNVSVHSLASPASAQPRTTSSKPGSETVA